MSCHIHFGYNFIAVCGILIIRYLSQCSLFSSTSVHSTDESCKLLIIQANGKERRSRMSGE